MSDFLLGLWPVAIVAGPPIMGLIIFHFVSRELKRIKAKSADTGSFGAVEGAREGAMSRDEAHLYTDECA